MPTHPPYWFPATGAITTIMNELAPQAHRWGSTRYVAITATNDQYVRNASIATIPHTMRAVDGSTNSTTDAIGVWNLASADRAEYPNAAARASKPTPSHRTPPTMSQTANGTSAQALIAAIRREARGRKSWTRWCSTLGSSAHVRPHWSPDG